MSDFNYSVRNQVDGNNVKQIANNPKPLEIERGHHFHTDSDDPGKRVDHPEYCDDKD